MEIKNVLIDVVNTVGKLGFDSIVIEKTEDETLIESFTPDRLVILKAKLKGEIDSFKFDKIGISNLDMLGRLLMSSMYNTESTKIIPNYDETKGENGSVLPFVTSLMLKSDKAESCFVLQHRKYIQPQPKAAMTGVDYDIVVEPTVDNIDELGSLVGVFKSVGDDVTPYTENNELNFSIGVKGTHNGFVKFSDNCTGELEGNHRYQCDKLLGMLNSAVHNGSKVNMSIHASGMLKVSFETEFVEYSIFLRGK